MVWLLVLLNCSRHELIYLLPIRKFREMRRFGLDFLAGVFDGIRGEKEQVYS
jgi:hypothetical protein